MNEMHSAGKTTVIKSDKFMKTNNLSKYISYILTCHQNLEKKTMASTLGTVVNSNTKVSTHLHTEENSKTSMDK